MNRLRYRSKFLLLGTALTVVLGVLLFSVYTLLSRDIQTAQNELNGLQMIKPLNRMAQYMQQHRGLSSGVLSGNEAMRPLLSRNKNSQGGFHAAVPMGLIWNPSVAARRFSAAMLRSRCCSS